ncbi:MAG TPA: DUF6702 family protein [Chitinophagaceae bacterium]|nr:DUF6702 family protein [Chitinophagaceae bacterium]
MAAAMVKWLLVSALGFIHPFYVSVTEINYNAKEKTLEISCKLFLDDTEKTIRKQSAAAVELSNPKDQKKATQQISAYVTRHLLITIDGKPVTLECIGYEVEGASVWSYYQVKNIASVHKIEVNNNLLYEMYTDQISIVHAQVGNNKKSARVSNPETQMVFEF